MATQLDSLSYVGNTQQEKCRSVLTERHEGPGPGFLSMPASLPATHQPSLRCNSTRRATPLGPGKPVKALCTRAGITTGVDSSRLMLCTVTSNRRLSLL